MSTRSDLEPEEVARSVNAMWWPELDELAHQIVARMTLLAEAPGAPVGGSISSGKPGSRAPRGDRALADIHTERLALAAEHDLGAEGQEPRRLRDAVVRAAYDLHAVGHRGQRRDDPDPDHAGVERHDRIIDSYDGLDPHVAATLESARAGWVSAEAIRRTRRANGRHGETGQVVPIGEQLVADVVRLDVEGLSLRDIARRLDVGKTTVARILEEWRTRQSSV